MLWRSSKSDGRERQLAPVRCEIESAIISRTAGHSVSSIQAYSANEPVVQFGNCLTPKSLFPPSRRACSISRRLASGGAFLFSYVTNFSAKGNGLSIPAAAS